jgi:hypothetical protein
MSVYASSVNSRGSRERGGDFVLRGDGIASAVASTVDHECERAVTGPPGETGLRARS